MTWNALFVAYRYSYPTIWSPGVSCLCVCRHATAITCLPTRLTASRLDHFFLSPFFNICQQSVLLHNAVIPYNWLVISIRRGQLQECEAYWTNTYISFHHFISKDPITMHQAAARKWPYSSSLCWVHSVHKAKTEQVGGRTGPGFIPDIADQFTVTLNKTWQPLTQPRSERRPWTAPWP